MTIEVVLHAGKFYHPAPEKVIIKRNKGKSDQHGYYYSCPDQKSLHRRLAYRRFMVMFKHLLPDVEVAYRSPLVRGKPVRRKEIVYCVVRFKDYSPFAVEREGSEMVKVQNCPGHYLAPEFLSPGADHIT